MFETISYRLDQFEGPLDLLLTLIKKNKVNITDIPIALICGPPTMSTASPRTFMYF